MEKDRSIAERRDVIIRKALQDMFALQRQRLGIVGATLAACVARPPNESGRRHPQHVAHHARSQIGSAVPLAESENERNRHARAKIPRHQNHPN